MRKSTVADFAMLLLISMFTFPRAYASVKLLIILVLLVSFLLVKKISDIKISFDVLFFFGALSIIGIYGSFVGALNGGDVSGIIDSLRLSVLWSACFIVLFTVFRYINFEVVNRSIIVSGILISLINFVGLIGSLYGINFFSENFIKEMDLFIGFHDGYVQITSQNLGMLFFIVPYLIAYVLFSKSGRRSGWSYIALICTFVLAILSGRRALWIAIALTPIFIFFTTVGSKQIGYVARRLMIFVFVPVCIVSVGFLTFVNDFGDAGFIDHLRNAFSSEDERSIQKNYILNMVYDNLIFGTGYGVSAGYVRSIEMPWIYELSHHQLLMNLGVFVGFFWFSLILYYLFKVYRRSYISYNTNRDKYAIAVGVTLFLVGVYSNPYLGSFDFIMLIGLLPYAASRIAVTNSHLYGVTWRN